MRSAFIFFLLLAFASPVFSQESKLLKAIDYYEQEKYLKAYKLLEKKVLKHKETKNSPEALMLFSKTNFQLLDNQRFRDDHPKALQDALKYAERAIIKDKDSSIKAEEADYLVELGARAIEEGKEEIINGRYTQAPKYFDAAYELTSNPEAKFQLARAALYAQDTVTAIDHIKVVVRTVFDSAAVNESYKPSVSDEPFALYVDHFIAKGRYDTAAYVADLAYSLYPESPRLKKLLLKAFLLDVTRQKPDMAALEKFARLRPVFKDDSLFVHRENVLFLYLLNNFAMQGANNMADSLLSGYIAIKEDYFKDFAEKQLRRDPLYDTSGNEFLFNLIRYSAKFNREAMLSMLLRNYVGGTYADSAFIKQKPNERWKALFTRIGEERSAMLLYTALPLAAEELKKESWFPSFKRKAIYDALKDHQVYNDRTSLLFLIEYAVQDFPKDREMIREAEALSTMIIAEYTDSSLYSFARMAIKQCDRFFPAAKGLDALKRKYFTRDFIDNYYGSRLLTDTVNGKKVSEFVWEGNELLCNAGSVPRQIHDKVEQRINYFRRSAGVPDYVRLDSLRNDACQKAALIYHANNNKRFTTPAETWKCFNLSAIDASRMSARVFGQTTVFAVTSLMADLGDGNTAVGNRRWLLYPPAKELGHGSTSNVSIIWTLDESGNKDTTQYMKDFVSWPPKDYCPVMFAFERWHFSIYADLSNAKVSMFNAGKAVSLKQEQLVYGYGMPSLVWKPEIKPAPESTYEVLVENVKLYGVQKPVSFRYKVTFIDPMAR